MGDVRSSGEDAVVPTEVGPGTVLSNTYKIERLLGRGGMGLVFEASHLRVPKRVAVKVLRTSPDSDQLARFRQEAEIASRLGHPNIVDVIDFDTLPSGIAFLVMELLEGESLAARMTAGRIPQPEALAIIRQIASALYAAHGAGVIHRDLKPENVFLCHREHDGMIVDDVKILDFGISKVQGSAVVQTREDVVLGTPKYMAPEQATAKHDEIDARTDQFSLGVIAYEMLSGTAPFNGDNATTVMFKIVYEPAPPLARLAPELPPHVVAAVERALAKAPTDRFADLSAFVEALTGKPLASERASTRGLPRLSTAPANATPRTELPTVQGGRASEPDGVPTVAGGSAPRPATVGAPTGAARAGGTGVETLAGPPPRPRSRWLPFVGLVVVAGIATAIAVTLARDDRPVREAAGSGAGSELALAPAPDAAEIVTPLDAAIVTPPVDAPTPAAVDAGVRAPDAARRSGPVAEAIPAEVLAEIKAAEAAFAAGRIDEAEAAAKRTFYSGRYTRAYQVLIAIACARRDVGAAHAWMRNVSKTAWPAARAKCKALDFPIDTPTQ